MRYFFHYICVLFVHFCAVANLQQVVRDVVELLSYLEPFCLRVYERVLGSICEILVIVLQRLVLVFHVLYEFYQLVLLLLQL